MRRLPNAESGFNARDHVETSSLGRWRWVTGGLCLLFIAVMIFLPLGTLVVGTFMEFLGHFDLEKVWTSRHWTGVFTDPVFLRSLKNTIILGLGAAILGALAFALLSYSMVLTHIPGRGVIGFPGCPGLCRECRSVWRFCRRAWDQALTCG
jgi:ABC-type Fe3+ transport system permease subunit